MTLKLLHVGDIHAEKHDLDDCSKLIEFVVKVANKNSVDAVVLEGDQYHNHSIVHLDVMGFWKSVFAMFKSNGIKCIALVGNHDIAGAGSNINAMMAHDKEIEVISRPKEWDGILFVPFMSNEEFVKTCNDFYGKDSHNYQANTVVCHQTFDCAKYDNGFYVKDGIDANLVPQKHIVSGHIHTPQDYGKVFYTGSPRWKTLSDANVERGIWLIEYDKGSVQKKTLFSTGDVCKRTFHLEVNPDSAPLPELDPRHSYTIDIKGSVDFVEKQRLLLSQDPSHPRLRLFPDNIETKVKESEGIDKAFSSYLNDFVPKYGTDKEILVRLAKERLWTTNGSN